MDAYLSKPLDLRELIETVEQTAQSAACRSRAIHAD
jgi:hypothetical protein